MVTHDIPCLLLEFNKNIGFAAAIENKWKKIEKDPAFDAGYYAAQCDKNRDEKMRTAEMVT